MDRSGSEPGAREGTVTEPTLAPKSIPAPAGNNARHGKRRRPRQKTPLTDECNGFRVARCAGNACSLTMNSLPAGEAKVRLCTVSFKISHSLANSAYNLLNEKGKRESTVPTHALMKKGLRPGSPLYWARTTVPTHALMKKGLRRLKRWFQPSTSVPTHALMKKGLRQMALRSPVLTFVPTHALMKKGLRRRRSWLRALARRFQPMP